MLRTPKSRDLGLRNSGALVSTFRVPWTRAFVFRLRCDCVVSPSRPWTTLHETFACGIEMGGNSNSFAPGNDLGILALALEPCTSRAFARAGCFSSIAPPASHMVLGKNGCVRGGTGPCAYHVAHGAQR